MCDTQSIVVLQELFGFSTHPSLKQTISKNNKQIRQCFFRFRVLLNTMMLNPKNAALVVHASCILHNYLSIRRPKEYLADIAEQTDPMAPDQVWHDLLNLADLERLRGRKTGDEAKAIRNHLRDYYCSAAGSVDWQRDAVLGHVSKI